MEYNYYTLIMETRNRLLDWSGEGLIEFEWSRDHLFELLGRPDVDRGDNSLSDSEASICRALISVHGFAIYKMLLARLDR